MTTEVLLSFPNFPFFVGVNEKSRLSALPSALPFDLHVHPTYAVPKVVLNKAVEEAISRAYEHGSMLSTPLGSGALGSERLKETRDMFLQAWGENPQGKTILEIGCGTGALLNEFKTMGANVIGCEIGPQGDIAAEKYGIRIIKEYLTPGSLQEKLDAFYSYGALEHIDGLGSFLETARALLKPNGFFFHVVPNADLIFDKGKPEDLCHEHVNYFTHANAVNLLESQGFVRANTCTNRSGNELGLWGWYDENAICRTPSSNVDLIRSEQERVRNFAARLKSDLERQLSTINAWMERGESVGFYAGGYIVASFLKNPQSAFFYDGDEFKHGKHWLASLQPIRAPQTLVTTPVDHLVICPEHKSNEIRKFLVEKIGLPEKVKVHSLYNLSAS